MKAYIINLACDTDRRAAMEHRLAATPFADAEFADAVDGRRLSPRQRAALFDYRRLVDFIPEKLSPGEAGCTLSHYYLWQRIAATDEPAVVMEDDITLDGAPWEPILAHLDSWLAVSEPRVMLLTHQFEYFAHTVSREHPVHVKPLHARGTVCYAINPAAARLLTSLGRPHYVADAWDYFRRRGVNVRAYLHHPVRHDFDVPSNITARANDIYFHRLPWVGRAPYPLTDQLIPAMWYRHLLRLAGILRLHTQS